MAYFPQLLSGTGAQYPVLRRVERRTVSISAPDGSIYKMPDHGWQRVYWRLTLRNLTTEERSLLESLFKEVEGRRGSFTFLDPVGNLLAWSEDLERDAWTKDPFVELTTQVEDPMGTRRAARLRNTGPTSQEVRQTLPVAGWFQYCLSVWARAEQGESVELFVRTANAGEARRFKLTANWQRLLMPVKLDSKEELVHFGLVEPPGAVVDVFGFQAEGQWGASKYTKTTNRNGVYTEARFAQDALVVTAEGPDCYSCVVEVVASGQTCG